MKILDASLRASTHKKYDYYIKQWRDYANNIGNVEVTHVLDFLSAMFDKGCAYSTINSAKCAIATIVFIPPYPSVNKHPLVKKYMSGIYNLRPPKPKLSFVWDVDILFRYFEQKGDNSSLPLNILTQKLLTLLLLLGAHRLSTIALFSVDHMILNDLSVTFSPTGVLKQSRDGTPLDTFEYRAYPDKRLCVIDCLNEYIFRRDQHADLLSDQLIITTRKPFHGASTDTMRRWMKEVFHKNNIINFSPHSCQAASTSKAKSLDVDIDEIIKKGCWKNRKNFFKFYDKNIIEFAPDDVEFNKICQR